MFGVGLSDIGPLTDSITIGKKTIDIHGLTAADIFTLMARFRIVAVLVEEGTAGLAEKLKTENLLAQAPEAVWAAMAACTEDPEAIVDPKKRAASEKAASLMPLSIQAALLNKIFKLSFREGVGPFVRDVDGITSNMIVKEEDGALVSGSPPPSGPADLQVDLPKRKLGRSRRANSPHTANSQTVNGARPS